ncbi:MAG TPA: universal stress protein [Blastocatellia bacterium]|nr:universal stress protein [Blastocatellia bacterium]
MTEKMKILLAYDGSDCANAALDDLRVAGLPAEAEVKVVAVLETWLPPPSSWALLEGTSQERQELSTLALAQGAAVTLRSLFPGWDLTAQEELGSPASVLLKIADDWQPDLLVVGSHSRSAAGRFFLGSVSQKLVHEAHCSVRVARGRVQESGTPLRIILGVDGSAGAEAAAQVVAQRNWPPDTEVKMVNAAWAAPYLFTDEPASALAQWVAEEQARIDASLQKTEAQLQAKGLQVTRLISHEEPKKLLCDEAERWGADCIFVGAKGISKWERMLIGSVSSAVAARAACSVEIVRSSVIPLT